MALQHSGASPTAAMWAAGPYSNLIPRVMKRCSICSQAAMAHFQPQVCSGNRQPTTNAPPSKAALPVLAETSAAGRYSSLTHQEILQCFMHSLGAATGGIPQV